MLPTSQNTGNQVGPPSEFSHNGLIQTLLHHHDVEGNNLSSVNRKLQEILQRVSPALLSDVLGPVAPAGATTPTPDMESLDGLICHLPTTANQTFRLLDALSTVIK